MGEWDLMGFYDDIPGLVMTNVAIENDHRNSGFTHEKNGDVP